MLTLQMDSRLAAGFSSGAQRSRVITEQWAQEQLYCAACTSDSLDRSAANTPAFDFSCSGCGATYQLKSMRRWNERRVVDGAYSTMVRTIREDRTPNLLLLGYTSTWNVCELMLVPSFFFSEAAVQARKPLAPTARRAGWIGCNIPLSAIAPAGKLRVVEQNIASEPKAVRAQYARLSSIRTLPPAVRGWTLDILRIVQRLDPAGFALSDVYAHEQALATLHPHNRNVRPKIRQQLQVLRDLGFLTFASRGHYVTTR